MESCDFSKRIQSRYQDFDPFLFLVLEQAEKFRDEIQRLKQALSETAKQNATLRALLRKFGGRPPTGLELLPSNRSTSRQGQPLLTSPSPQFEDFTRTWQELRDLSTTKPNALSSSAPAPKNRPQVAAAGKFFPPI